MTKKTEAQPAPAQDPVAWEKQILDAFPLFDDDGLNEEEHHCEWALQQDRKRLHTMLTNQHAAQRQPLTVWQPIETAPKSGVWIVVFDNKGEVHPDYWLGSEINQWAKEPFDATNTHWMPLPDAPSAHEITEAKP